MKKFINCMLIFLYLIAFRGISSSEPIKNYEISTYIVSKGDTLWSIASKYKPVGADIRKYIEELKEINGMENANITVGQNIKIVLADAK